ncbi:hypothetical protein B0H19DRAFT_1212892 [Mycena capillaripes]|nr:hypothetical protein B0H19DRAFT_1212892 [Mycena capillaripes]
MIDGQQHIDRCNNFGNRSAGRIFTSFIGLVNWIANDRGIDSKVYIDNSFGAALADEQSGYEPYGEAFPSPQADTLRLWDEIGLPHEREKQIWGARITVIGFQVDPNAMTFTMSDSKRAELLAGVEEFCHVPPGGRRHPLKLFRRLAGWVNWSLNIYGLLKPALSHVYKKMEGKSNSDALIFVNRGVINDLAWFSNHVRNSSGVHLLESLDWDPLEADIIASAMLRLTAWEDLIFYFEAFCVCWCLHQIATLVRNNGRTTVRKITIWTDNSNTYNIFNSLRALPLYNEILKSSVDVLIANDFNLRVLLIPGKKNVVADALSHWKNDVALANHPDLLIDRSKPLPDIPFTPPRAMLGAGEE